MVYDCQTCGACCHGLDVLLDEADEQRFARRPSLQRLTVIRHTIGLQPRFMRRDARHDRCVALSIGNGPIGSTRCACTIYPDRPQLCREFESGSEDCLASRRAAGLPVEPDAVPPAG